MKLISKAQASSTGVYLIIKFNMCQSDTQSILNHNTLIKALDVLMVAVLVYTKLHYNTCTYRFTHLFNIGIIAIGY